MSQLSGSLIVFLHFLFRLLVGYCYVDCGLFLCLLLFIVQSGSKLQEGLYV